MKKNEICVQLIYPQIHHQVTKYIAEIWDKKKREKIMNEGKYFFQLIYPQIHQKHCKFAYIYDLGHQWISFSVCMNREDLTKASVKTSWELDQLFAHETQE